jgi:hypothetical protein
MNTQQISGLTLVVVCIVLLFTSALAAGAAADATGCDLSWWTTEPGGRTQAGAYVLGGTAGQADAGVLAGGAFRLVGGYWLPFDGAYSVYLPAIRK